MSTMYPFDIVLNICILEHNHRSKQTWLSYVAISLIFEISHRQIKTANDGLCRGVAAAGRIGSDDMKQRAQCKIVRFPIA